MRRAYKLCILVVICTVYILIGYSIFVDIQQYKLFTSYYTPNKYVHLVDNFDETMNMHREDEKFTEKLRKINMELKKSDNYIFSECRIGEGYLEEKDFLQLELEKNENGQQVITVLQIGENLQNIFPLAVKEGDYFEQSDYVYDSKEIPILIGATLESQLKIGDSFNCIFNGVEYVFVVKGILSELTSITYLNHDIYLDEYIVMPFENFMFSEESYLETEYAFRTLLEENNGIVKFLNDTGAKELDGDLQQFSVEYALPSYSVSLNYYEIKQEYITRLIIKILFLIVGIILSRQIWKTTYRGKALT